MSSLTKRHAAALERLFDAEIRGSMDGLNWPAYPVKLGPKIAEELRVAGFAEHVTINVLPRARRSFLDRIGVSVSGWALTRKGYMAYCEWATEDDAEATQP